jgi:16S rRNA (cytidine1402-2'-O)-methyltransferase
LPSDGKSRKKLIEDIFEIKMTLVFYVSPHALQKDVSFLESYFKGRKACLVKEITKKFEQTIFFSLGDVLDLSDVKGEFVLIVEGAEEKDNKLNFLDIEDHIGFYIGQGFTKTDAIKKVAKDRKVSKNEVYQVAIKTKKD